MIRSIKWSLISAVIVLLLTVNTSAQETLGPSELAGTYISGHNFGGSTVTLREDGTYRDSSGSCTFTTEESGTFIVSNGTVRFKMLKYIGRQNGSEQDVDLFDAQARMKFFGYRDSDPIWPLTTEYALRAVTWGERIYLLDEKNFDDFARAINLGLEPRSDSTSEPYVGSFYLRKGDEKKDVSGMPSLPKQWLSLLLEKPVTAKIVSVYGDEHAMIAIIDKGSRHGLKAGVTMIGKDERPGPWTSAEVISVEERFARVRVAGEPKVGDKLTTKFERKDIYR